MRVIRIGSMTARFEDAQRFVAGHVDPAVTGKGYPAYDAYPGSPTDMLGEQDLLAPALLNAFQKPIESYYSLLRVMPRLNELLSELDTVAADRTLANADEELVNSVAALYRVLDETKVKQIGRVKLSKVLHRKRPNLIPITDRQIALCYTGQLGIDRNRSYEEYAQQWLHLAQQDFSTQVDSFAELAKLALDPVISPLRAMDIVGWGIGSGYVSSGVVDHA